MSFFFFFFLVTSISNTRVPIFFLFFFCFGMVARDRLLGFFYWVSDRVAGGSTGSYFFFIEFHAVRNFLSLGYPIRPYWKSRDQYYRNRWNYGVFFLLLKKMESEGVLLFFLLEPGISVTRCRTFLHGEYFCVKIPYFFMVHLWLIFLNRLNELSFLFFSIRSYS